MQEFVASVKFGVDSRTPQARLDSLATNTSSGEDVQSTVSSEQDRLRASSTPLSSVPSDFEDYHSDVFGLLAQGMLTMFLLLQNLTLTNNLEGPTMLAATFPMQTHNIPCQSHSQCLRSRRLISLQLILHSRWSTGKAIGLHESEQHLGALVKYNLTPPPSQPPYQHQGATPLPARSAEELWKALFRNLFQRRRSKGSNSPSPGPNRPPRARDGLGRLPLSL